MKPKLFALDMESTLTPEIWLAVGKTTGHSDLLLTTREIKDFSELMRHRIKRYREIGYKLADIQKVIATIEPLPGARVFLDWLRKGNPIAILSDTFYEFAMPLVEKLGSPMMMCHSFTLDPEGYIADFHLRANGSKAEVVRAFKSLGFDVTAIGDSFNDTKMMEIADRGYFIHAPDSIAKEFPQFPAFHSYDDLKKQIESIL